MEQELEVVRAKHKAEEEEVRKRCKEKVDALEEECSLEVEEMKESIRELKVILSTSEMEEDLMEQTRSELECPVSNFCKYFCSKLLYEAFCLVILSFAPKYNLFRCVWKRCDPQLGFGSAVMVTQSVSCAGGSQRFYPCHLG